MRRTIGHRLAAGEPEQTDGRQITAAWHDMLANLDADSRRQERRVAEAEKALNRLRASS